MGTVCVFSNVDFKVDTIPPVRCFIRKFSCYLEEHLSDLCTCCFVDDLSDHFETYVDLNYPSLLYPGNKQNVLKFLSRTTREKRIPINMKLYHIEKEHVSTCTTYLSHSRIPKLQEWEVLT